MGGVQESFYAVYHTLFSARIHLAGRLGINTFVPTNIRECKCIALKFSLLCLLSNKPLHLGIILHCESTRELSKYYFHNSTITRLHNVVIYAQKIGK